jgi:hypothetical protein
MDGVTERVPLNSTQVGHNESVDTETYAIRSKLVSIIREYPNASLVFTAGVTCFFLFIANSACSGVNIGAHCKTVDGIYQCDEEALKASFRYLNFAELGVAAAVTVLPGLYVATNKIFGPS